MYRALEALGAFAQVITDFRVSTTIAVATSALRDAPNKQIFLKEVYQKYGLRIRIISGEEEARFGATAANLLLPVSHAVTIDIGGGSSDISLIRGGKVIDSFSLNLGTVRLKELFFDQKASPESAQNHIKAIVDTLPKTFRAATAIGIGGSARALAKSIIKKESYPFNKLHAFRYRLEKHERYLHHIAHSSIRELTSVPIQKSRHDTIREGTLIFLEILKRIGATQIITSGVGVREGVYLSHIKLNPPKEENMSIRSIRDRFDIPSLPQGNRRDIGENLYALFGNQFDKKGIYLSLFHHALTLSNIGKMLTIYHQERHANYIAIEELNYGFTHEEMLLISLLLYSKSKKGYHKIFYKRYKELLPPKRTVKWLSFLYTLTLILHRASSKAKLRFRYEKNALTIKSDHSLYIAMEEISFMKKPKQLKISSVV